MFCSPPLAQLWELRDVLAEGVGAHTVWKSSKLTMPDFVANTFLDRLGVCRQQRVALGGKRRNMLLHTPHVRLVANTSNSPLSVMMMAFFACAVLANFALMRSEDQERIQAEVLKKTSALNFQIAERLTYQHALEQSRLEAESANMAKSQFLNTMSHALFTPMNGILRMAQLLMMDRLTERKRREYMRTILELG
jgi:signal transduction histidine kinase